MTLAAAIESRTAGAPARSQATRISRVEIFDELGQAESVWRGLQDQQHFSTPFQRFDFLRPWQQLVGERASHRPFIVDALVLLQQPLKWQDQPNPLALLPHQPSVNDCPLMTISPDGVPTDRISHS